MNDFNIDNETFAAAYKCLKNANLLLDAGLGNFNELDSSALSLIEKKDVSNSNRLDTMNKDCYELSNNMYRTIDMLSNMSVESANFFMDYFGDELDDMAEFDLSVINLSSLEGGKITANIWNGSRLTAGMGGNAAGPSGYETWYPDAPVGALKFLENEGFTDLDMTIRDDGVRILSGKTPDGEEFKNLVVVATDVYHETVNPEGTFKRGELIPTSLGMGIVVDYCQEAVNKRNRNAGVHVDIATSWHTGKYMADAYDKNKEVIPLNNFEQVLPGKNSFNLKYYTDNEFENDKPTISLSTDEMFDEDKKNDISLDKSTTNKSKYYDSVNIKSKNNSDISHRGYRTAGVKDNSAEAFKLAGEKGFWGCEADVRFGSDKELVCSHNTVKKGENPPTFDEYLDICKEYGMSPIIDLKYIKGTADDNGELSQAILKALDEKGMMDSAIIQTNNRYDVAHIRNASDDARIWFLTDEISDKNLALIEENNVECVNISASENNANRIRRLTDSDVDICVWNVQTEKSKEMYLNMGAKYVMSDNVLGITPYQEGDVDFNAIGINENSEYSPVLSLTTDAKDLFNENSIENIKNSESFGLDTKSNNNLNNIDLDNNANNKVKSIHSDVPLFYQSDYTNVSYGSGTLASHGCGIASLSMVASYYNDTDILPDELAKKYRKYGSESGTDHMIFEKTANELNLPYQEHVHYSTANDLKTVVDALDKGCVVVAKAKQNSIFTDGGHYIVLTGVTDDGKINVNDPNKYNYKEYSKWCNDKLTDGFANGFDQEEFKYGKVSDFFIYSPKSNS